MKIEAIRTRVLKPPKDDLLEVLAGYLPPLEENSVVVISSKVVAIWQGRCEKMPEGSSDDVRLVKDALAREESEAHLERDMRYKYSRLWTVYEGVLTGRAGIDESNGEGYFILLPKDAKKAAQDIRAYLREQRGVEALGIIITDSRSVPMRNGTLGVALGHAGMSALYDYRGRKDIFGRMLEFERMNVVDSLATAANLVIGEGDENTPLAVCTDIPHAVFTDDEASDPLLHAEVTMDEDLFAQFLAPHEWQKKCKGK